jgi:FkbM family methyltransferase
MKIRGTIRDFLNKRGYDIVKTGLPVRIYDGQSAYPGLSYHITPIGNYYLPEHNDKDVIIRHMKRGVMYDMPIVQAALDLIHPGSCVIDVGANFGQMTIAFSKAVGHSGVVHSFEAQAFVFDILQKNITANSCDNVQLHYAAVFDKDGEIFYFHHEDSSNDYGTHGIDLSGHKQKGQGVKSLTIDALNIEQPVSFMKVDIQGSDLYALKGAVNTIRRHRMPLIFEYEEHLQEQFGTNFQDYVDFVQSIGYRFAKTITRTNFLIVPKEYSV